MFLVMLYASLEAVTRRPDIAAVVSALIFAVVHVPMNLPANEFDWVAAIANALFYQATVGIIACLAFTRHRAPVPIGVAHAMAIA
jgi:membrane protease YdiL (CAAX protease family)